MSLTFRDIASDSSKSSHNGLRWKVIDREDNGRVWRISELPRRQRKGDVIFGLRSKESNQVSSADQIKCNKRVVKGNTLHSGRKETRRYSVYDYHHHHIISHNNNGRTVKASSEKRMAVMDGYVICCYMFYVAFCHHWLEEGDYYC